MDPSLYYMISTAEGEYNNGRANVSADLNFSDN